MKKRSRIKRMGKKAMQNENIYRFPQLFINAFDIHHYPAFYRDTADASKSMKVFL